MKLLKFTISTLLASTLCSCKTVITDFQVERKDENRKNIKFETINAQKAFYAVVGQCVNNNQQLIKEEKSFTKTHRTYQKLSDVAIFNDQVNRFDSNGDDLISAREAYPIYTITIGDRPGPYNRQIDTTIIKVSGENESMARIALQNEREKYMKTLSLKYNYPLITLVPHRNGDTSSSNKEGVYSYSQPILVTYSFAIHLKLEAEKNNL